MSYNPQEDAVQSVLRETEIEKQNVEIERVKRSIQEMKDELNDDAVDLLVEVIETRERAKRVRSKAIAVDMLL